MFYFMKMESARDYKKYEFRNGVWLDFFSGFVICVCRFHTALYLCVFLMMPDEASIFVLSWLKFVSVIAVSPSNKTSNPEDHLKSLTDAGFDLSIVIGPLSQGHIFFTLNKHATNVPYALFCFHRTCSPRCLTISRCRKDKIVSARRWPLQLWPRHVRPTLCCLHS